MNLRKEVLRRLLLAKSILSPARAIPRGQRNEHVVARQILSAQDAADLVFAAIADQQNKLPPRNQSPSMLECLRLIDTVEKHLGYFKQLNDVRISLKHVGILPNTNQWGTVADDVFEKLSEICEATLKISLDALDESELLQNEEAKAHLLAAKTAKTAEDFKLALEEIAKALSVSLNNVPGVDIIEVGRAKAEDALKLTAFGISANDFLRLQDFLPNTSIASLDEPNRFKILWKQHRYGHPGNWDENVVTFCISACLDVALGIQNAPAVPYPIPFEYLYDYKITAEQDDVEVWDDLIDEHLTEYGAFSEDDPGSRPFRSINRHLAKGESITLSGSTQPLVSEDRSLDGKPIERVQVTNIGFSAIAPHAKAEFVDRAQVRIACAPSARATANEAFSNLPEIPFDEDSPS